MIVLFLQALKKFFFESVESLNTFAVEKVLPKGRAYFLFLLVLAFLAFIPPAIFFYLGILAKTKSLIVLSGALSAFFLLILMGAAAPLIIIYQMQKGGLSGAIPRTLTAIGSVFVTKLILTLIACFIPFEKNLAMIPVYLLSSFLFGLMFTQIFKKEVVAGIVTVFFVGIAFSFFAPGLFGSIGYKTESADDDFSAPKEAGINCTNYTSINYFLSREGEPKYLYRINDDGKMELLLKQTSDQVFDPKTGETPNELGVKALKRFKAQMKEDCTTAKFSPPENITSNANSGTTQVSPLDVYIVNNSISNNPGVVDIAVFITDENGNKANAVTDKIAQTIRNSRINATATMFSESFAINGEFAQVFSQSAGQLNLENRLDYLLLGKTKVRTYKKYSTEQRMELVNAEINLEIVIVSAKTGLWVASFSLPKTYLGFDEADAIENTERALALAVFDQVQGLQG